MTKLVLANRGYAAHTTDEGLHLEDGLHAAGWCLAGFGVGDDCTDVPTLLARYTPRAVMVQDVRDWHRANKWGCFDPRYHFQRYEALRKCGAFVATPFKDAGSMPQVQRDFLAAVQPGALITYYHERSVNTASGGYATKWRQIHVATASRFHFALRKIIESVAVGCVPVTNLPAWDVLPEIDDALVRVPDAISMGDLRGVIDAAERGWDLDRARHFAERALEFYDYRAAGLRLDAAILEAAHGAGYRIT